MSTQGLIYIYSEDVTPMALAPEDHVPPKLVAYLFARLPQRLPLILEEGYERITQPKDVPADVADLDVTQLLLVWDGLDVIDFDLRSTLPKGKLKLLVNALPQMGARIAQALQATAQEAAEMDIVMDAIATAAVVQAAGADLPGTGLFGSPREGEANRRRRFRAIRL